MLLPLTLATFRGVLVQASNQDFIIPTQNIKRVLRLTIRDIKSIENRPAIVWENRTLSFISLGDLLGLPPYSGSQNAFLLILILKAGEKDLAVGVDRILSEQEVLVKTLGKQLQRVKSISAATILEGGRVVPILDPFDLIKSLNKGALASIPIQAPSLEKSSAKQILIAEDSVTARILLKNILESAGYQVKTAVDGAEALSLLKTEKFDLLVSDIEMPRMTGLELTSRVRKTEALKSIPIVLCTSKGSREDREKGIEVGANAYIDKNSFSHSSLLDIIQKLL
jgi:two-component system, chemotaxis family, sensor kinase CheA